MQMSLSIIAALAENRVIGHVGNLPWHLAADLKRFKRLTMGHSIIMGRKTWQSIGRPLPGRRTIVLSRQTEDLISNPWPVSDVHVVGSLQDAFKQASDTGDDEPFIIGGQQIYQQALPHADRLYLTRILAHVVGDTLFPEFDETCWQRIESESHAADIHNDHPYRFEVFVRGHR